MPTEKEGLTMESGHPECQDDEVYVGNTNLLADEFAPKPMNPGWRKYRLGEVAYYSDNRRMGPEQGLAPVFVKKREVIAVGLDPDEIEMWPVRKS